MALGIFTIDTILSEWNLQKRADAFLSRRDINVKTWCEDRLQDGWDEDDLETLFWLYNTFWWRWREGYYGDIGIRLKKGEVCLRPTTLHYAPSSNSMSQMGLDSLDTWPVGWSWCTASAWDDSWGPDLRVCEIDREAVVWFRKGFSNAFFMFLTLTCPKPGRLCSWSVVTLETFAKLWNKSIRGLS